MSDRTDRCPRRMAGARRRRRPGWAAVAALSLAGLVTFGHAGRVSASDARRQGLAGNLGLEDLGDVFGFPQLARSYADLATIDVTDQGAQFRGGVLLGRGTTVGLFVRRPVSGDWFSPFDDSAALTQRFARLTGAQAPADVSLRAPEPLIDAVLALPSGFGFGLKVANAIDGRLLTVTEPGPEEGTEAVTEVEEGAQATTVGLSAGWTHRQATRRYDLAAHLTFNRFKTVVGGKIRGETTLTPSLLLLGRGTLRSSSTLSWVGLGQLYVRNYDVELPYHSNTVDEGLTGLQAAVGPRVRMGDGVELVALAWLGWDRHSYALGEAVEDGTDLAGLAGPLTAEDRTTAFLIPGLDLGLEIEVKKWLLVRAGWAARYRYLTSEAGPDERVDLPLGGAGGKQTTRTELRTHWAAGMSLKKGGFVADGSFTQSLLNEGPNLIGGRSPGTFAWVSLSYSWGSPAPQRSPSRGGRRAPAPEAPGALPVPPPGYRLEPPADGGGYYAPLPPPDGGY